jgi:hypothetical protein
MAEAITTRAFSAGIEPRSPGYHEVFTRDIRGIEFDLPPFPEYVVNLWVADVPRLFCSSQYSQTQWSSQ